MARVTESKIVVKRCYERFKEYYSDDDTYKDILEACREFKQLQQMEKGVKINARERGFHVVFKKAANKVCYFYIISCCAGIDWMSLPDESHRKHVRI